MPQTSSLRQRAESFSYSVSHDLLSPRIRIDGFSRLLITKYQDVLDAHGWEHLQRVRVATHHVLERIDALRTIVPGPGSASPRWSGLCSIMGAAFFFTLGIPTPDLEPTA